MLLALASSSCRLQRPRPGPPANRGSTLSLNGIIEFPGLYADRGGAVTGTVQFVQGPGVFQIGGSGELLVIESAGHEATPVRVGDTVQAIGNVRILSREGYWPTFSPGRGEAGAPPDPQIDWSYLEQWQGRPVFDAKLVRVLDNGGTDRFPAGPSTAPAGDLPTSMPATHPADQ